MSKIIYFFQKSNYVMDAPPTALRRQRRHIGMCKRADRPYMASMSVRRLENKELLANGRERTTLNATRAAESRCRSTNHIATLTQFAVNIGVLLQQAQETGEDVTLACRDMYLTAMTNMTASFGRILPANRCVERSIFDLHHQIKQLVDADVIQCLSATDPVLTQTEDTTVTLVGTGPVREPAPMLVPQMHALTAEQTQEAIASMEAALPAVPATASMADVMSVYTLLMSQPTDPPAASALAQQEFDFM
jgi:hypothetical protein